MQEQTNYYDYGFRQLDPQLGRWHVVDAMAEKTFSESPYAYVSNNPIFYNDPTGLLENPGFSPGVWTMITNAWNSARPYIDGGTWKPGGGGGKGTFTPYRSQKAAMQAGIDYNNRFNSWEYTLFPGNNNSDGGHWETDNYFQRRKGAGLLKNLSARIKWILNGNKPGGPYGLSSVWGRKGDVWVWDNTQTGDDGEDENGWGLGGEDAEMSGMIYPEWDLNKDDKLQKNEADNWWKNGKGKEIWVDNSKIDWSGLKIPEGKTEGGFSISTTDAFLLLPLETASTYGGTSFEICGPNLLRVIDQLYHFNYRKYDSAENYKRNIMNWIGKPKGNGNDFMIHYYYPYFWIK